MSGRGSSNTITDVFCMRIIKSQIIIRGHSSTNEQSRDECRSRPTLNLCL